MGNKIQPSRQGQICQKLNLAIGDDGEDVYIVTDFVISESLDSMITVVSLNELQRNSTTPDKAERIKIIKSNLHVVAEDLTSFVKSWNT